VLKKEDLGNKQVKRGKKTSPENLGGLEKEILGRKSNALYTPTRLVSFLPVPCHHNRWS
jgi:hypothetical protein